MSANHHPQPKGNTMQHSIRSLLVSVLVPILLAGSLPAEEPVKQASVTDPKRQAPSSGGLFYLVNPVLIDGRVFYRGEDRLHCLDLRQS